MVHDVYIHKLETARALFSFSTDIAHSPQPSLQPNGLQVKVTNGDGPSDDCVSIPNMITHSCRSSSFIL